MLMNDQTLGSCSTVELGGSFYIFPGDNTMAESVNVKYLLKFCGGWECKNEDWVSDYCCLSGLIYFFELKNVGCRDVVCC